MLQLTEYKSTFVIYGAETSRNRLHYISSVFGICTFRRLTRSFCDIRPRERFVSDCYTYAANSIERGLIFAILVLKISHIK